MAKYTQRDIDYLVDYHNANITGGRNYETNGPFYGVDWLSSDYLEHMKYLSEKYSNLPWLPLAVPKIEIDNIEEFLHFWDQESVAAVRKTPDVAEPWTKETHPLGTRSNWYCPKFKDLALYEDKKFNNQQYGIWESKLFEGKNSIVDRLLEQVFEYYPISKTNMPFRIFIWESLADIQPHKDQSAYWNCLTDFRSMLYNENTDPVLYVIDTETKKRTFIDPPPDTNTFGWSNGKVLHGSDYHGKRKLLLIVNGIQCPIKTETLLESSIEKYKNQLNYPL